MAGEIGQLEIGARINRQQLQNDIQSLERDLGKIRAGGEKTTATIERLGKASTWAGAGLVGMATAGVAALTSLTSGSPYLVGEKVQQDVAKQQIEMEGGKITLPIEKLKTEFYQALNDLISNAPEQISAALGTMMFTGMAAAAGLALKGLGAAVSIPAVATLGSTIILGAITAFTGGIGAAVLNWVTDKLGITNKETDTWNTIKRVGVDIGGGALAGAGTGALIGAAGGPIGAGVGAIIGAIGGAIYAGIKEWSIRQESTNQSNRKYDETRQEYLLG